MKKTLLEDMKQAMIEKDLVTKNCIQMLRSEILNEEKEKQREITNEKIYNIIQKEIKIKEKALKDFEKGNRDDLINKTKREISILENYLPIQLSEEELTDVINKVILENSIEKSKKNFGNIIKLTKEQVGSQADGKLISQVVNKIINE